MARMLRNGCYLLCCALLVVSAGTTVLAVSYRCGDRDCDISHTCTWLDRTFPLENVCVAVIPTHDKKCVPLSEEGWICEVNTFAPPVQCATVYWNYLGPFGGDVCVMGGPNCGPSVEQGKVGQLLQSCRERFGS